METSTRTRTTAAKVREIRPPPHPPVVPHTGRPNAARMLRDILKRRLRNAFEVGQRFGFDLLPRHFYSEIPDIKQLRAQMGWRKELSMVGVQGADADEQLAFARATITPELSERTKAGDIHPSACQENGADGFGPIEAEFLHSFIYTHRPARMLQVGAGVSTSVCLRAALEAGYELQVTCIDPYPTHLLQRLKNETRIELIDCPAQEADPGMAAALQKGDLLFIDSSHALGPAGEATRLILEWLPRVRLGVRVHFHDILFPYDYAPAILGHELFFTHESTLLHGFLCMNQDFRILASLSMLHYKRQSELMKLLPGYRPCANSDGLLVGPGHYPSSIFLERIS